jgi:hypothetical protein
MFSQLRKHENVGCLRAAPLTVVHGRGFYKSGERVENSPYLARVFESIPGVSSFRLIAHPLCEPQCAKNVAGARYAATNSSCDLTGGHLFTIRQQGDHGEGNGVAKKTAQPRLPVAYLFHERCLSCFRNCENMRVWPNSKLEILHVRQNVDPVRIHSQKYSRSCPCRLVL